MLRLLRVGDGTHFTFETFPPDQAPPYATLSHTWGEDEDEVTYHDVQTNSGQGKKGWSKLLFSNNTCKSDRLGWFWMDSCCIDKRNDAELSTAIRSMFQWYAAASRCYVIISDAKKSTDVAGGSILERIKDCRWFKRGWTLQELLAPPILHFYLEGERCLSRADLCREIHMITGISLEALSGAPLGGFHHTLRLKWAENRQTKIPEDRVYSLLGICGISMSPRYGEGYKAARHRLESKIVKLYGTVALNPSGQHVDLGYAPTYHNTTGNNLDQETKRNNFLSALKFDTMSSRQNTISAAASRTCAWMLDLPMYQQWLGRGNARSTDNFLWIRGKPGTGKSVMMKYIHNSIKQDLGPQEICLSFYFSARGHFLEKTIDGMYRSILVQLLEMDVALHRLVDASSLDQSQPPDSQQNNKHIPDVLRRAVLEYRARRIYVFIDALDECHEDDVEDMIVFWQKLNQDVKADKEILFCFASRHYPILDIATALKLTLEDMTEHSEDILNYTHNHLKVGSAEQLNQVSTELVAKANGIFLWTVLVVGILNREFLNGRIFKVRERLSQTPRGLTELFDDIVSRDQDNIDEMVLCLRWITCAQRPLTLQEFYFAMVASLDPQADLEWRPGTVTLQNMHSYLLSSSKGLAELTRGDDPRVQFIHEAVNDFLRQDFGIKQIVQEGNTIYHARSHDLLKSSCARAIRRLPSLASPFPPEHTCKYVNEKHPLAAYALHNVWAHADSAALGIPQAEFIEAFDFQHWRQQRNCLMAKHERYLQINIVWLCVERNYTNLLYILDFSRYDLGISSSSQLTQSPVVLAIYLAQEGPVQLFLKHLGIINATQMSKRLITSWEARNCEQRLTRQSRLVIHGVGIPAAEEASVSDTWFQLPVEMDEEGAHTTPEPEPDAKPAILHMGRVPWRGEFGGLNDAVLWRWATLHGLEELALHLLRSVPASDLVAVYKDGYTALGLAVEGANMAIVKHILHEQAKDHAGVSKQEADFNPPLFLAIEQNNVDILRVLLRAGMSTQVQNARGTTLWDFARMHGSKEVHRILRDHEIFTG